MHGIFTGLHTRFDYGPIQEIIFQCNPSSTGNIGDPLSKDTSFGPQADTQQHKSVSAFVEQAKNDRLKVLLDSSPDKDGKNFVSPMVLHDVPESHNLMQEEIFG